MENNPITQPDKIVTRPEYLKAFPAKSNCNRCLGRGYQRLMVAVTGTNKKGRTNTIKGLAEMKDGSLRKLTDMEVIFCSCVIKKYNKYIDAGGEILQVHDREPVT